MKKVIIKKDSDTVNLEDIPETTPIFAKKNGKLRGMVVCANSEWAVRLGGDTTSMGCFPTRRECVSIYLALGPEYELYVED